MVFMDHWDHVVLVVFLLHNFLCCVEGVKLAVSILINRFNIYPNGHNFVFPSVQGGPRLMYVWASGHLGFWASGHLGFWASEQ